MIRERKWSYFKGMIFSSYIGVITLYLDVLTDFWRRILHSLQYSLKYLVVKSEIKIKLNNILKNQISKSF
jgi:hypothetical protein